MQERRHGPRVSLSAQQLESLSNLASDCTLKVATIGVHLRVRGVQAPVCKPLLSVGEYTTMGGVTVLYGDKGYMFHKGSNVAKNIRCMDPEGDERFTVPRLYSCVQREQRIQHQHETGRKRD